VTLSAVLLLVASVGVGVGELTVVTFVSLEGSSIFKGSSGMSSLIVSNVEEIPVLTADIESETGVLLAEDAVEVTVLKAEVVVGATTLMGEDETVVVNKLRV
jgi:hypothetical protein